MCGLSQTWPEWKESIPWLTGDGFPNAAPNIVDFHYHTGALLADGQFIDGQQHHQVFFCQAAF